MFNKYTNMFLVCMDDYCKSEMASEGGADEDFHVMWLQMILNSLHSPMFVPSERDRERERSVRAACAGVFVGQG